MNCELLVVAILPADANYTMGWLVYSDQLATSSSEYSKTGRLVYKQYFASASDMTAYLGGNASKLGYVVHYTYDPLGRPSSTTDSTGTTSTIYDLKTQQPATIIGPEGMVNDTYDPLTGEHTGTTTAGLGTTPDLYNVTVSLPAASGQGTAVFTWDAQQQAYVYQTSYYAVWTLSTQYDHGYAWTLEESYPDESVDYRFTGMPSDSSSAQTGLFDPTQWTSGYVDTDTHGWGSGGLGFQLNLNTGMDIRYGYDALGRLQTVSAYKLAGQDYSSNPLVTTYGYTAAGTLASVKTPDGVETDYSYDGLNRLVNETIEKVANGIITLMQSYNYILRADGNRASDLEVTYGSAGTVASADFIQWTYDALDRLTSETRSSVNITTINNTTPTLIALEYSDTYTLDLNGNRLTKVHVDANSAKNETITSHYNERDQLMSEVSSLTGTTIYTYDANGSTWTKINTTTGTHVIYGYDLQNRMIKVDTNGDGTPDVSYLYDSSGNKVGEVAASGSTYYLEDTNNPTGYSQELEESATKGGTPTAAFVFGNQLIAQQSGGTLNYLLTDGHGSTRILTTSSGTVLERYTYDAYGNAIGFNPTTALTTHLFTAEQFDAASGWYNQRARWYVTSDGRFSTSDAYMGTNADPLSLHKYLYTGADPINMWDPTGHDFNLTSLAITVGIVTLLAGGIWFHSWHPGHVAATAPIRPITINIHVQAANLPTSPFNRAAIQSQIAAMFRPITSTMLCRVTFHVLDTPLPHSGWTYAAGYKSTWDGEIVRNDSLPGTSFESSNSPKGEYSDPEINTNAALSSAPNYPIMWANLLAHEQVDHGAGGGSDQDGTGFFTDGKFLSADRLEPLPPDYAARFRIAVQGR